MGIRWPFGSEVLPGFLPEVLMSLFQNERPPPYTMTSKKRPGPLLALDSLDFDDFALPTTEQEFTKLSNSLVDFAVSPKSVLARLEV